MRELERIKRERAEDAAKKAAEEAARSNKEKEKELRTGNPLLGIAQEANFAIKRRCVRGMRCFVLRGFLRLYLGFN